MNNEEVIASGLFERIGLDGVYTIKYSAVDYFGNPVTDKKFFVKVVH